VIVLASRWRLSEHVDDAGPCGPRIDHVVNAKTFRRVDLGGLGPGLLDHLLPAH